MTERVEIIPAEIDQTAAQQRTVLFERYRSRELDGYQTYRNLLNLYWDSLHNVNEPTACYLMDATFDIADEASLDVERVQKIYEEEQRKRYN
jgi:predicted DNA-binding ribbon-helix-helix protein